jgi:hypothetical protein
LATVGSAALVLLADPATLYSQISFRPHKDTGIPVAKVSFLDGSVEVGGPEGKWARAGEGTRVHTGDRVRTDSEATARIEFPFMNVVLGPSSIMGVAPSQVLSTLFETGRLEEHAEGSDAIKLQTPEAQIRGRGRVVVRRFNSVTSVMVWEGRFLIGSSGRWLTLVGGVGTVVERGKPLVAAALPPAPADPSPGPDPLYVSTGDAVSLKWESRAAAYHVQLLGIDSDEVLLEREAKEAPVVLTAAWPGTFRWHVSERDTRGLESRPSRDGYLCVVGK